MGSLGERHYIKRVGRSVLDGRSAAQSVTQWAVLCVLEVGLFLWLSFGYTRSVTGGTTPVVNEGFVPTAFQSRGW